MLGTISQVMAMERAVEKVNQLEKRFEEFKEKISNQISQVVNVISASHREEPSVDAHIE